jgi:hypothetical protein
VLVLVLVLALKLELAPSLHFLLHPLLRLLLL